MKRTGQMAKAGIPIGGTRKEFISRITGHHMHAWETGPLIVFKPSWFKKIRPPRIRRTAARPFIKTIEGRWNQSRSKYMPHDGGGQYRQPT